MARRLIAAALAVVWAAGAMPASAAPSPPRAAAREAFRDLGFGIFLHWGLYSQLAGGGKPVGGEWIMEEEKIPAARYERLAGLFNPTKFDADAWVQAVKAAGAGYLVITTKHHEGFAMYGSKLTPYNIVDATPFGRDPMAELAAACARHGIKLFFYYSILDWHHPDYAPLGLTGTGARRPAGGSWARYQDYVDGQLTELMTRYGPIGGVWFDGYWDLPDDVAAKRWDMARFYATVHRSQPNALIVDNNKGHILPGEDYQTYEKTQPGETSASVEKLPDGHLPLEMSETMNESWGFNLADAKYKSPRTLVRTLVGAAGRDANLLLNIGPMPDGRFPPEASANLAAIGGWMKTNGRSIIGTRAGPVPPRPWGVTTRRGNVVYIHVLDWQDDVLTVPLTATVTRVTTLDGRAVPTLAVAGGIQLGGLGGASDAWDRIYVAELR